MQEASIIQTEASSLLKENFKKHILTNTPLLFQFLLPSSAEIHITNAEMHITNAEMHITNAEMHITNA